MTTEKVTQYVAEDGKRFPTEEECRKHDLMIRLRGIVQSSQTPRSAITGMGMSLTQILEIVVEESIAVRDAINRALPGLRACNGIQFSSPAPTKSGGIINLKEIHPKINFKNVPALQ